MSSSSGFLNFRIQPWTTNSFSMILSVSGGFGVGSKSAATSPTGSSHGTPTHQNKPQTLDPFADLGTLGMNSAG